MKLADLVDTLGLDVRSGSNHLDNEVRGGYVSDLLSDVIANSEEGDLWVTLQTHVNVVAVASMKVLAGIVLVNGREPQEDAIEKAGAEGIPVMISKLPAFELVGRLHQMGVRGKSQQGGEN